MMTFTDLTVQVGLIGRVPNIFSTVYTNNKHLYLHSSSADQSRPILILALHTVNKRHAPTALNV